MRGSGRGDEDEGIHEQPAVQVFRVLALAVRPLLVLDRQPLGAFQVSLKRDTRSRLALSVHAYAVTTHLAFGAMAEQVRRLLCGVCVLKPYEKDEDRILLRSRRRVSSA